MSDWNEELSKYKAKERGIVEQRPAKGKKPAKKREWKVYRESPDWMVSLHKTKEWVVFSGLSLEHCQTWLDKYRRSYYARRHAPASETDASKVRQEQRADRCWIRGPDGYDSRTAPIQPARVTA